MAETTWELTATDGNAYRVETPAADDDPFAEANIELHNIEHGPEYGYWLVCRPATGPKVVVRLALGAIVSWRAV